uniref:uncharacterized protein LOC120345381 isoform X1 n=1 Tax=Styela clava TaxID=7725 RepID=UPI001939469F|nr:uncharacterized protein LOC120345381 isoform X1 [Styela clava]
MDTSPTSAPVYGGGLVEVEIYADIEIPEFARLFLVFDGSKQRQVTEARITDEGRKLEAVIPDHEPPEIVALSLIIKLHGGSCRTLAQEPFTYYLDQTCYLARYLADSVHDLESLEDWDYIRGPKFSLADENFPTLDERLTSAFQHLILPTTWNLLGDPTTVDIPRETLFHFAARLGLSSFVTLLLEKRGAAECLQIRNKHNELAKNIARSKSYDGLADLITDPHAHGVIRWESTHRMTQSTTIKRHSFGTVTTSTEMQNGDFPPIEEEIDAIVRDHPPPTPDKPESIKNSEENHNNSNNIDDKVHNGNYDIPAGLEVTNTTNATWGSEDESSDFVELPPPVPPKPKELYLDYEYDSVENGDHLEYTQNETSSYFSPNSIDYSEGDAILFQGSNINPDEEIEEDILEGNLRHLQQISTDIHYIRQKDIARLKQSSPADAGRLSNSCPNLGQDSSYVSNDTDYLENFDSPAAARSRQAISSGVGFQHFDAEFQSPVETYGSADDLLSKPHNRSPLYIPDPPPPPLITMDQNQDEIPVEEEHFLEDWEQEEEVEEERPTSPNKRPHSWHSVEKLNELKPDNKGNEIVHSHKRSQSYQGDEFSNKDSMTELTPEEKAEQADTITSPSIRRVRRHNNNAFAVVGPESRDNKARSISLCVNNNNNAINEADRRFTISEGLITEKQRNSLLALQELIRQHDELINKDNNLLEDGDDDAFSSGPRQMSLAEFLSDPANFEADGDTPPPRKPEITRGYAAKPFVPPRPPDAGPTRNIVSRKLSFLSKMRNSTRTKTNAGKDRVKKGTELKANSIQKPSADGGKFLYLYIVELF